MTQKGWRKENDHENLKTFKLDCTRLSLNRSQGISFALKIRLCRKKDDFLLLFYCSLFSSQRLYKAKINRESSLHVTPNLFTYRDSTAVKPTHGPNKNLWNAQEITPLHHLVLPTENTHKLPPARDADDEKSRQHVWTFHITECYVLLTHDNMFPYFSRTCTIHVRGEKQRK